MELYDIWKQLDLSWQELEHEPVFTIEQAQAISDQLPGIGVKNLLLTDRKHTHYCLVLLHEDKRADVKSISQQTGVRHLTFGSTEELQQLLGLTPGSVSPFGIIHDRDNRVQLVQMPVIDSLGEEFLNTVKTGMTVTVKEDGTVCVE